MKKNILLFLFSLILFFTYHSISFAAGVNISTSLVTVNQTIKAGSVPTAIFGFNLATTSTDKFASVRFSITAGGGFSTTTDLATFSTATSSGIAIYRDSKTAGVQGSFDSADTVITLANTPTWIGATTTLTLLNPEAVPTDNLGVNAGNDYFLVIQTGSGMGDARTVSFNLYPGEIGWSASTPTITPTPLNTSIITTDITAPTVTSTGPANNSTSVPISMFINANFSENMDVSTLTGTNISLTSNGNPVGVGINAGPMAFNVVVSNPPTYATGAKFSKVANTAFGWFQVIFGQTIYPAGGSYSTPVSGDIVYFQHDTFPMELGLVTNTTMTGGTFAVNNFPLFGGQNLIKFKAANSTGLVSATTNLTLGDLVVTNTSANPTSSRYAWHIVTSSAPANSANLRLDDSSVAPTYASSTITAFSTITPTATTTANGSNQLATSTTFTAGDLIFAKVTANSDNLNSYAWHIVTTAETVANGVAPSTLRLDGGTGAPTFISGGTIAKLSPSGTGAITDTTTSLSYGDLLFTKTTANAGSSGFYDFHLVSSGNNGTGGVASTNLRLDNNSTNLATATNYVLTIGTGVKDTAGNPLTISSVTSFTTGATGGTNITPPFVQSSQPASGNQTFAPNGTVKATFSVDMATTGSGSVTNSANVGLYNNSSGTLGTQIATTNTYDSVSKTVSLAHAALGNSTDYILVIKTTIQSTNNIFLGQEYRAFFKTASTTDTITPTVLGVYPSNNATNVSKSVIIKAGFSEDIDPSSVTTSSVTLKKTSDSSTVSGNVSYDPQSRSVTFVPSVQLAQNIGYTFTIASTSAGVKDLAGNSIANDAISTFTTDNTVDNVAPSVSFSNADNFGIAVTFSEPVKQNGGPNAADNIVNYTLESPVGSSISLGGKTVTYDAGSKTARISGLSLQNGNAFKIAVSNLVQDLAANGIDTSGTPAKNTAFGTVANSSTTGGQLGPGSGPANDPAMQGQNPIRVTPFVRQAGATSSYHIEFLASTNVPLGGRIVLTFPTGFDVTNAAAVATTASFCNSDINGPGSGTVTMGTFINDAGAGTVSIPTAGSDTGTNAFLCFDISGIVNSNIPSASGYTVDIKTRNTSSNNLALLDSKTSAAFFLGQAGSNTLSVHVFHDDNSNNTKDSGEEIINATVFLFSPASGGQTATTSTSGVATFSSLSNGDYQIGVMPGSLTGYAFNSAPQQINIPTVTTKKFIISAAPRTISGTVYGPANTKVDVFAGSSNGFSKTAVTTNSTAVTYNSVSYAGSVTYSLGAQNNTTYQVGVGPSMPETSMIPGAPPPPPPTFTFMPPPPVTVPIVITNFSQNFTLTSAGNTISGTVKDSSSSAISNAGVFCRPNQTSGTGSSSGFGTGAMTGTDGRFSIKVTPGVYICGVFKPGMPQVPDKQVSSASDGTQTPTTLAFTLGSSASSLTVSGTIKDDNGNAVAYAGVSARKVNSTSDTTAVGGGTGNFVGGPADSNGNYTLYVSSGTWVVEAFAPGFGRLGTKTLTVSSSSLTGQDFSAQTLNMGTITGTATQVTTGIQGVMVRAETSDGSSGNMATTISDGTYSLKVPAGTYSLKCFFPGIGEATPVTGVVITSGTTSSGNDCSIAAPITVTVRLTDGTNPITGAFVDVRDSNGRGNGTNVATTSTKYGVYTLTVPPGTYKVRAGHPSYGPIGTEQTATTTQTITLTTTAGTLFAVTGSVTGNGTALSGAWVSLTGTPTGQTNFINMGGQTDSSGNFSINVPAGSYKIKTNKPSYKSPSETSITVIAAKVVDTMALTTASRTISGTVTVAGSGVSGAFVDANDGSGGFAVAQTNSAGAYSLSVDNGTWTIRARSQGFQAGPTSVTVSGSNQTLDIALNAISGFTVKPERQENITPTSGGLLTNPDIGGNFKMNIPANALGTSANAGTVTTQPNTAVPTPSSGTVLAKNAVTISATDSSGSPIKNLNDNITIVVPYTVGDIPTGYAETDLVLGVWNDATQSYDSLPTTIDTTNHTMTAVVSHFSDFAPIINNTSSNGTTASTASASASSGGGGGVVGGSISFPGAVKSRPQIIYPDGRIVYLDQKNTGPVLAVGTKQSSESNSASSSSNSSGFAFTRIVSFGKKGNDVTILQTFLEGKGFLQIPQGVAKGYFGVGTRKALQEYQKSVGLTPVGVLGPATKALVEKELGAQTTISPNSSSSSSDYTRNLSLGSKGDDVTLLQTFLEDKGFLKMPQGTAKGYFGVGTRKALQEYQKSVGLTPVGALGPATRQNLNSLPK